MACLGMPMKGSQSFPKPSINVFLTFESVRIARLTIKDPKSDTRCDASIKIRSNNDIYCDF